MNDRMKLDVQMALDNHDPEALRHLIHSGALMSEGFEHKDDKGGAASPECRKNMK